MNTGKYVRACARGSEGGVIIPVFKVVIAVWAEAGTRGDSKYIHKFYFISLLQRQTVVVEASVWRRSVVRSSCFTA